MTSLFNWKWFFSACGNWIKLNVTRFVGLLKLKLVSLLKLRRAHCFQLFLRVVNAFEVIVYASEHWLLRVFCTKGTACIAKILLSFLWLTKGIGGERKGRTRVSCFLKGMLFEQRRVTRFFPFSVLPLRLYQIKHNLNMLKFKRVTI